MRLYHIWYFPCHVAGPCTFRPAPSFSVTVADRDSSSFHTARRSRLLSAPGGRGITVHSCSAPLSSLSTSLPLPSSAPPSFSVPSVACTPPCPCLLWPDPLPTTYSPSPSRHLCVGAPSPAAPVCALGGSRVALRISQQTNKQIKRPQADHTHTTRRPMNTTRTHNKNTPPHRDDQAKRAV